MQTQFKRGLPFGAKTSTATASKGSKRAKIAKQPVGALFTEQRNVLAKSLSLVTGNTEENLNFKFNCNGRPKLQQ
jgi:hypothetical protein